MALIELPYFAPNPPHPLPTKDQVDTAPVLIAHNGYRVVHIKPHIVVKYGSSGQLNLIEGENMLFVRQMTAVRMPQVYALYTDPVKSVNYIVMEYIEGDVLASQWPNLTPTDKTNITNTLKKYFDQLRSLPSPGYFGGIGRRPLPEGMIWSEKPNPQINGPLDTEHALNTALALKYVIESDIQTVYKAAFYRRTLAQVFQGHDPIFTHGDFQRKNIIIRRSSAGSSDFEVTLIDWQTSGWYPSYWEYSMAMSATRWNDDWDQWVSLVLRAMTRNSHG
ncbi:hypothetical protein LOZ61_001548 [Ophidiomyces ophidiicola]|nr:hypothetical protein LOZ61_001548 [Ophidiomyces ophidiicola]KAI1925452.1 hypothetical protein LOZ60_004181 [Ophidiomyces ophidiicola]KAI1964442.1 hypothetical protein LOZ59_001476 [Ophidiomyces ophidiicola]KAI2028880.1 hypothetical protein LOZ48_003976 [Ophidiomyces ophidiicola]KAI2099267.1 hypothetical protein LOZ33_002617 [Ophidiomyces ophidiicola]